MEKSIQKIAKSKKNSWKYEGCRLERAEGILTLGRKQECKLNPNEGFDRKIACSNVGQYEIL
jgi:uncharacterized protein YggL (DUF469 family)